MMQFITHSIGILAITTLPVMNEIVLEIQNKLIPDIFIPYLSDSLLNEANASDYA